jgi:hypothetical protein
VERHRHSLALGACEHVAHEVSADASTAVLRQQRDVDDAQLASEASEIQASYRNSSELDNKELTIDVTAVVGHVLRGELLLYEGSFLFVGPWNWRKLFFARTRKDR